MSHYIRSAEILERLRLHFPVSLTVPDPISGSQLTLHRDNVHAQLVIEAASMGPDQQSLPALYVEMARAQRACEKAAAMSEAAYRTWKANKMQECRDNASAAGEKKPTINAQEGYYRNHPEYAQVEGAAKHWKTLADLLGDIKYAFKIKADIMNSMGRNVTAHDSTLRAEDKQEEMSLERVEELARGVIGAGGTATGRLSSAEPNYSNPPQGLPAMPEAPSADDDEEYDDESEEDEYEYEEEEDEGDYEEEPEPEEDDEDDDEEDEEEDDEDDFDDPPPPPPKRTPSRKKAPAKKKAASKKKTTKKATRKRAPRKAK